MNTMARDDRWDDDDVDDAYDEPRRRRGRAWEDDDYEIERYQITRSSGAVIGAGVFSIVWGSLVFLGGGCIMVAALASPDAFGVRVQVRDFVAVAVAIFALLALWGLCAIIAAIGVLTRGNWGRIFTFVLGGFAILFGILFVLG